jgi:hypothetical protein
MTQDLAAFVGAIAITAGLSILVAPPLCRLLGSLLTRHAAGMEAAYKAYASGWRGEEERIL